MTDREALQDAVLDLLQPFMDDDGECGIEGAHEALAKAKPQVTFVISEGEIDEDDADGGYFNSNDHANSVGYECCY